MGLDQFGEPEGSKAFSHLMMHGGSAQHAVAVNCQWLAIAVPAIGRKVADAGILARVKKVAVANSVAATRTSVWRSRDATGLSPAAEAGLFGVLRNTARIRTLAIH